MDRLPAKAVVNMGMLQGQERHKVKVGRQGMEKRQQMQEDHRAKM